ncbi:MAG: hypothetical protein EXR45_00270 [Chloroflexi bacterium]|nr:hypothetical protein [Chloroflexota bacterium]
MNEPRGADIQTDPRSAISVFGSLLRVTAAVAVALIVSLWCSATTSYAMTLGDADAGSVVQEVGAVLKTASSRQFSVPANGDRPGFWVYVPAGPNVPRVAVIALHGMGQKGDAIGGQLMPFAQARNWVIIAPTLDYGEWREPDQLVKSEPRIIRQVMDVVSHVQGGSTGVSIQYRFLTFGFSRGAQTATRLGLIYPDRVIGVGAASAGTYTMPTRTVTTTSGTFAAPFPFGTDGIDQKLGRTVNLDAVKQVRYWIGVGELDSKDADVPRQWDIFQGKNRAERAEKFARAVQDAGCVTRFLKTRGVGHELPTPVIDDAVRFLSATVDADLARTGTRAVRVLPLDPGQTSVGGVTMPGLPPALSTPPASRTSTTAPWPWELSMDNLVSPSSSMPLLSGRVPVRIPPIIVDKARDPSTLWWRLVGRHID